MIYGMTEIDLFNANSASENIAEVVGTPFAFKAMGILADEDNDVAYIVKDDGTVYGCISAMIIDAVKRLIPMLEADNRIVDNFNILITTAKSKNKRDFYRLMLVSK